MLEVPGSTLGGDGQFSFFFLVEKNFDDSEKIPKGRTIIFLEGGGGGG